MGPETDTTTTDTWQMTAGLKGKLPFRDWTWDIYGSQGKTQEIDDYSGLPSLQRLTYLDQLPNFGKGASVSAPAGTPFGYGESCTSGLPVFQQFTPSSGLHPEHPGPAEDRAEPEADHRRGLHPGNAMGTASR